MLDFDRGPATALESTSEHGSQLSRRAGGLTSLSLSLRVCAMGTTLPTGGCCKAEMNEKMRGSSGRGRGPHTLLLSPLFVSICCGISGIDLCSLTVADVGASPTPGRGRARAAKARGSRNMSLGAGGGANLGKGPYQSSGPDKAALH